MRASTKYLLLRAAKPISGTAQHLCDILIKRRSAGGDNAGEILEVGEKLTAPEDCEEINLRGRTVMPAFIDIHCHLRDPGYEYKEDIITGTAAAAAGGFGTVVSMPNTLPVTDNPDTLDYIRDKAARRGSCRVLPAGAITRGLNGEELTDFRLLREHGAILFTDDGRPVANGGLMRRAMLEAKRLDLLIMSHSEDKSITGAGVINEGRISALLNVKGIPASSEESSIAREILLAAETGCRLHVTHISTARSVEMVRLAKAHSLPVTCDTCPHYFSFTEDDVIFYGANAKMSPPLRTARDREAIIEGLLDGTIDCIATDHAPHSSAEKRQGLEQAPFGIIGLQTAFPATFTKLVATAEMTLTRLSELMSENPAKLLGLKPVRIQPGSAADLVVVSPGRELTVSTGFLKSKSYNTPFMGMNLRGVVEELYLEGEQVWNTQQTR